MNNLIEVKNLTIFRGNQLIFKNLNFSLKEFQAIHLLGENGEGKTTFLQALSGLLVPENGEIIKHCDLIYLGHLLGIKLNLTVLENLNFMALLYHNISKTELNKEVNFAIKSVGLEKYKNILVSFLSAGQKRKVQLARLFFSKTPKLWLLDEPFNTLDQRSINILITHFENHIKNGGSLLLTSHQNFSMQGLKQISIKDLFNKNKVKEQENG